MANKCCDNTANRLWHTIVSVMTYKCCKNAGKLPGESIASDTVSFGCRTSVVISIMTTSVSDTSQRMSNTPPGCVLPISSSPRPHLVRGETYHQPTVWDQIAFSRSSNCTGARRNPMPCSTNQCNWKRRLARWWYHAVGAAGADAHATHDDQCIQHVPRVYLIHPMIIPSASRPHLVCISSEGEGYHAVGAAKADADAARDDRVECRVRARVRPDRHRIHLPHEYGTCKTATKRILHM